MIYPMHIKKWCNAGKPKGNHPLVEHRKRCKQQFRRVYRTEIAMRELCLKEKVMNIRTKDSKIFHMLINRQRQSILVVYKTCILTMK